MPSTLIALVLGLTVLVACARLLHRARRKPQRAWRTTALLLAQGIGAVLLYFTLWPPPVPGQAGGLVVLTAGIDALPATAAGERVVALPEAPVPSGVERVPDLGTALRRYPDARPLRVFGAGLGARDHDAARGLDLQFEPAPLPPGLVQLDAPTLVTRGRRFVISGVVNGGATATVDLVDPADQRLDRALPGQDGAFTLSGRSGPAGRTSYQLQRRDTGNQVVEQVALPLQVQDGDPLRVLALAGGASPELKYLRRWVLDAGMQLHTRISLGGGVDVGDAPIAITAATLREFDLVVLDERAWRDLGDGGRAALLDATQAGLGVLLRITGELAGRDLAALQAWGFTVAAADIARSTRLPGTESPDSPQDDGSDETRATDTAPLLSRRPLRLSAADGAPLLRDTAGATLALWRPQGRGRIALWTLSDSFRLVLAGRASAYGSLWAGTFETLARAQAAAAPQLPSAARVSERAVLCGLTEAARLHSPDGQVMALAVDPATGGRACAAFWPAQAGWHELRAGERTWAFPVRDRDEAPGLVAAGLRESTLALANAAPALAVAATPAGGGPGERWPWALAWMLLSTALWWLERSRPGTAMAGANARHG